MGLTGCAIDCAVCRRPFITEARFRSQVSLDGIRGAESVTRTGLSYTGCPRRNGQNFGRVFLMLNYTDITQNTYIQS